MDGLNKKFEEVTSPHKSVMTNEVVEHLAPKAGGLYVDATFGVGGHSRAILDAEPKCRVLAIDWDIKAIDRFAPQLNEEYGSRIKIVWGNFALLHRILRDEGVDEIDGLVADFGTSQVQISETPGISFMSDSELDMRMSPAHQKVTAAEVLAKATEKELRKIFSTFGEEPRTNAIARAVILKRKKSRIRTAKQLAKLIEGVYGGKKRRLHPATLVFQALRIYVNKELENIKALLHTAVRTIKPGGRIVCISFHSLEDRQVKEFFAANSSEKGGRLQILTKRAVRPTLEEVISNSSSRSAKLRAAEVLK